MLNGNGGSKLVKRAINKYGIENFIYGILEYYPFEVNKNNNEELYALETAYISLLVPKYNIMTEAGQFFGYKNKDISFSKNINLMRLSLTEERKMLLKKLREDQDKYYKELKCLNLKNIAKKRPSDYISEEGLKNISKTNCNRKHIYISFYEGDDKPLCKFNSINVASHYLCTSTKTIERGLNLGWIYIPDLFIPFLNDKHLSSYYDIISHIDQSKLDLYNYTYTTSKKYKLKSGLSNYKNYTRFKLYFKFAKYENITD